MENINRWNTDHFRKKTMIKRKAHLQWNTETEEFFLLMDINNQFKLKIKDQTFKKIIDINVVYVKENCIKTESFKK